MGKNAVPKHSKVGCHSWSQMPHPLSCDVLPSRPEWSLEHWHLHKAVHWQLSVSPHGNSLGPHRWKTHSCHECFGHHRKSAKVLQNPSVPVPCLKSVQPCLGAHCLINRTWFEPTNDRRNVCIALCNFYTMRLCAAQSAAYIAKWFGASPGLWPLAWYQPPASTSAFTYRNYIPFLFNSGPDSNFTGPERPWNLTIHGLSQQFPIP